MTKDELADKLNHLDPGATLRVQQVVLASLFGAGGPCHENPSGVKKVLVSRVRSGRSGRNLPCLRRLGPEGPEGAAGDEVALTVERIMDRSMHGEKALG